MMKDNMHKYEKSIAALGLTEQVTAELKAANEAVNNFWDNTVERFKAAHP